MSSIHARVIYKQSTDRQDKQTVDVFCFLSEIEIENSTFADPDVFRMISVGSLSFLQLRPNDATRGRNNINFNTRRALIAQSFSLAGCTYSGCIHTFKSKFLLYAAWNLGYLVYPRHTYCVCIFVNIERFTKEIAPKPNSHIYIKLPLSISNVWRYRSVTGGNRREWIVPLGVLRHKFRRFCSI